MRLSFGRASPWDTVRTQLPPGPRLPPQLQEKLLALYPIPPFKGTGLAPSDLALFADQIVVFSPASSVALTSPSA